MDLVENFPVSVENRLSAGVISVNFCVLRYRINLKRKTPLHRHGGGGESLLNV
jgi:hypothetical protein